MARVYRYLLCFALLEACSSQSDNGAAFPLDAGVEPEAADASAVMTGCAAGSGATTSGGADAGAGGVISTGGGSGGAPMDGGSRDADASMPDRGDSSNAVSCESIAECSGCYACVLSNQLCPCEQSEQYPNCAVVEPDFRNCLNQGGDPAACFSVLNGLGQTVFAGFYLCTFQGLCSASCMTKSD